LTTPKFSGVHSIVLGCGVQVFIEFSGLPEGLEQFIERCMETGESTYASNDLLFSNI
jgi:hypothetical protein